MLCYFLRLTLQAVFPPTKSVQMLLTVLYEPHLAVHAATVITGMATAFWLVAIVVPPGHETQ